MKRDVLRLVLVLVAMLILLPTFAWVQSKVGYETFSWAAVTICVAVTIVSVLVTAITLRRERKKENE